MRAPLVPRHSWLGCAVWVCVLGLGLWLRPATPGSGVGACVCLCACSACTPPLLACLCGVHVCVRARFLAAPRHSWPGCWGVCVIGLGFWVLPPSPGWGVRVCVCLCVLSSCTSPLLARVCGVAVCTWARASAAPRHSWLGCWDVCVCVRAPRLYPAISGPAVRCGCVCLGSGFGCSPPLLAGVLWCVCVCVCSPLVPRLSRLGCAVLVCMLGLGLRLRPATPGLGVGVCVFVCALPACTPPFLAWISGVTCDLTFTSSTTVVDRNCAVFNMCKSVLGQTKVKQVKQCHKHVENMVKT